MMPYALQNSNIVYIFMKLNDIDAFSQVAVIDQMH
jgi:hypothetical protein